MAADMLDTHQLAGANDTVQGEESEAGVNQTTECILAYIGFDWLRATIRNVAVNRNDTSLLRSMY